VSSCSPFFRSHCHFHCNLQPSPFLILHSSALKTVATRSSEKSVFSYKFTWWNRFITSLQESRGHHACSLPI
jgi:hypothetical protein